MNPIILALPGNETLAQSLISDLPGDAGALTLRAFPDGESYLRIDTELHGRDVVIAATLDHPNEKLIPLYLLATTARQLGARRVLLAAPYMPYLRQDQRFHPGEALSAQAIARLLSAFLDGVVTIEPHLHRIHALSEVFKIPATSVSAAPALADWVREHVPLPLLIGPDDESRPWVAALAERIGCPYQVLRKVRLDDHTVEVSAPHLAGQLDRTPVLVDDIISTGRTLIAAIDQLRAAGAATPICIGVHALFVADAAAELRKAGATRVVTGNSIAHVSNGIDLHGLLLRPLRQLLAAPAAVNQSATAAAHQSTH